MSDTSKIGGSSYPILVVIHMISSELKEALSVCIGVLAVAKNSMQMMIAIMRTQTYYKTNTHIPAYSTAIDRHILTLDCFRKRRTVLSRQEKSRSRDR